MKILTEFIVQSFFHQLPRLTHRNFVFVFPRLKLLGLTKSLKIGKDLILIKRIKAKALLLKNMGWLSSVGRAAVL